MFSEDYDKNKGDVLDFSFTSVLDMPLWIRLQAAIEGFLSNTCDSLPSYLCRMID